MNTHPRIITLLALLAIWLPVSGLPAAESPTVAELSGQWHGMSRFTGISYAEATQKQVTAQNVAVGLQISADGTVTGRVGGAELRAVVRAQHRGWLWRMLHDQTNFIIEGTLVGPVAPGSESGRHPINAPFGFDGTRINGSLFVIYPIKYPYPFLKLRLNR